MATKRNLLIGACVIAIVAILLAVGVVLYSIPRMSTTLPCSAQGVTCSSWNISSIQLDSPHPPNGSLLILNITNNGETTLNPIRISINNQAIALEQGLAIGQTVSLELQIPQNISIVEGQTYTVRIESSTGPGYTSTYEFGENYVVVAK